MEMVRAAAQALLVLDVRKAVGALGILLCVLERCLRFPGTRPGANRVRDRRRLVDGAPGSSRDLGFLRVRKRCVA
jgi:hypothetical protein